MNSSLFNGLWGSVLTPVVSPVITQARFYFLPIHRRCVSPEDRGETRYLTLQTKRVLENPKFVKLFVYVLAVPTDSFYTFQFSLWHCFLSPSANVLSHKSSSFFFFSLIELPFGIKAVMCELIASLGSPLPCNNPADCLLSCSISWLSLPCWQY